MNGDSYFEFSFATPEELSAFAAKLAPSLKAGDFVALRGDLGAGKSHFARAAIKARLARIGSDEDIPSPTYTLVQTYWDGTTELWHADLYRLGSVDGLDELGLGDALETSILFVEWPDLLISSGVEAALVLDFSYEASGDGRRIVAKTRSPHILRALQGFAA